MATKLKTNISNNDYQHDSRVLYTFVPNKSFGQLLEVQEFLCHSSSKN